MRSVVAVLALLVLVACGSPAAAPSAERSLILATTTSTQDSGLLDDLLPAFTADTGWQVKIVPETAPLVPDQSVSIQVTVTPPAGFKGTQPINVNAFHEEGLAGGVTLGVTTG